MSENSKETKKDVLVDAGYCDDSSTDAGWMPEILSSTVNEYVVDLGYWTELYDAEIAVEVAAVF